MKNLTLLNPSSTRKTEVVLETNDLTFVHMIFNSKEGLPIHPAHADLNMTVLSGTLTITLDGNEQKVLAKAIVSIPFGVTMHVRNEDEDQLELLVIKDFSRHKHS